MIIAAIDPGDKLSAIVFMNRLTYQPVRFLKADNETILQMVRDEVYDTLVIERIASCGMLVGREVFLTCEWVGRFTEASNSPVAYIYRREEKLHICGDSKAKDTNIRRALIDRFAKHDLKNGKGTKKDPDWFYGFKADCWQAYAVGLTYIERSAKNG